MKLGYKHQKFIKRSYKQKWTNHTVSINAQNKLLQQRAVNENSHINGKLTYYRNVTLTKKWKMLYWMMISLRKWGTKNEHLLVIRTVAHHNYGVQMSQSEEEGVQHRVASHTCTADISSCTCSGCQCWHWQERHTLWPVQVKMTTPARCTDEREVELW